MGILKNGILGPVSNKVGAVIGRNFRGLNVITQLYKRTQKPATVDQKRGQDKLGLLSSFLSQAETTVDQGFIKTAKGGQSALNAAYSFNYQRAFVETEDELKINYPNIVLSRGSIERPNCATVMKEDNTIVFRWLAQAENSYSRYNDSASFLIYSVEQKKMKIIRHSVLRSTLKFEFELPKSFREDTLHCYIVFSSHDGKLVGTSEYVGFS